MSHIVFTVTNDLNYDQRMMRICDSLFSNNYSVTLVGVNSATPLHSKLYDQKRLNCFFKKGFGFYAEYNIRLFFFLMFFKADVFCCIDLDTILPVYLIGKWRRKILVYDAHEYFSQQKEIITRPPIFRIWNLIENTFVPKFKNGYTVSDSIAIAFKNLYKVNYEVIKNATVLKELEHNLPSPHEHIILYQGAVNEARGLEYLIPAMKKVEGVLHIYGDGNLKDKIMALIQKENLQHKVLMKGKVLPSALDKITQEYYIGINLVENMGLNQYYSLANKFFDYIHAGIPQITMNFPEYKRINDDIEVAVLIDNIETETITEAVNSLLYDLPKYKTLQSNCFTAKKKFNWQEEEKKLLTFYEKIIKN